MTNNEISLAFTIHWGQKAEILCESCFYRIVLSLYENRNKLQEILSKGLIYSRVLQKNME